MKDIYITNCEVGLRERIKKLGTAKYHTNSTDWHNIFKIDIDVFTAVHSCSCSYKVFSIVIKKGV